MSCCVSSVVLLVFPMGPLCQLPREQPPRKLGWKDFREYHVALRQHLIANGERKLVERIDAAVKRLVERKQWRELWELTQDNGNLRSNASWYAASKIASLGSDAKNLLPFMSRTLWRFPRGSPKAEIEWPCDSAGIAVGLSIHDIFVSIGKDALPYLIAQIRPSVIGIDKSGESYRLGSEGWPTLGIQRIVIGYELTDSVVAQAIQKIMEKSSAPIINGERTLLRNTRDFFLANIRFKRSTEVTRSTLKSMLNGGELEIRLYSALIAMQDPALIPDVVGCIKCILWNSRRNPER